MKQLTEAIDIRDAFFDELYQIAKQDKNVIFLTADMGAFSLNAFKRDMPEQFINVGIAEQNMVSVAAGLAMSGKRVFIYAIAPFITQRCFEQIKIDLCAMKLPVTLIGSGPGLSYSNDGPTHHAIEDIAIMRALPGMVIFNPCDQFASQAAARLSYRCNSPVYVRLDKGKQPIIYDAETNFSEGIFEHKKGKDILVISTGLMTHQAFDLAKKLCEHSVDCGVMDIFQIKPFNKTIFMNLLKKYKAVVVIEEHNLNGGIGSCVSEFVSEQPFFIPMKRFGINDKYSNIYGTREWLHNCHGLDIKTICDKIINWLKDNQIIDVSGNNKDTRVFGTLTMDRKVMNNQ